MSRGIENTTMSERGIAIALKLLLWISNKYVYLKITIGSLGETRNSICIWVAVTYYPVSFSQISSKRVCESYRNQCLNFILSSRSEIACI